MPDQENAPYSKGYTPPPPGENPNSPTSSLSITHTAKDGYLSADSDAQVDQDFDSGRRDLLGKMLKGGAIVGTYGLAYAAGWARWPTGFDLGNLSRSPVNQPAPSGDIPSPTEGVNAPHIYTEGEVAADVPGRPKLTSWTVTFESDSLKKAAGSSLIGISVYSVGQGLTWGEINAFGSADLASAATSIPVFPTQQNQVFFMDVGRLDNEGGKVDVTRAAFRLTTFGNPNYSNIISQSDHDASLYERINKIMSIFNPFDLPMVYVIRGQSQNYGGVRTLDSDNFSVSDFPDKGEQDLFSILVRDQIAFANSVWLGGDDSDKAEAIANLMKIRTSLEKAAIAEMRSNSQESSWMESPMLKIFDNYEYANSKNKSNYKNEWDFQITDRLLVQTLTTLHFYPIDFLAKFKGLSDNQRKLVASQVVAALNFLHDYSYDISKNVVPQKDQILEAMSSLT